jgi:hypothetical protein
MEGTIEHVSLGSITSRSGLLPFSRPGLLRGPGAPIILDRSLDRSPQKMAESSNFCPWHRQCRSLGSVTASSADEAEARDSALGGAA